MNLDDIVYRLRLRAEIRRQISTRKSVQEGKPDRIADLLEEAANEIDNLRIELINKTVDFNSDNGHMNNKWEVILEEDEHGEIILPLGEEFMTKHGWLVGDQIDWKIEEGCAVMTNLSAKAREQAAKVDSV